MVAGFVKFCIKEKKECRGLNSATGGIMFEPGISFAHPDTHRSYFNIAYALLQT